MKICNHCGGRDSSHCTCRDLYRGPGPYSYMPFGYDSIGRHYFGNGPRQMPPRRGGAWASDGPNRAYAMGGPRAHGDGMMGIGDFERDQLRRR